MIRVVQQGAAWTVVRDGQLMREGAGAAVHKTREQAERHAARLAAKLHEPVHGAQGAASIAAATSSPVADADRALQRIETSAASPVVTPEPPDA
jgi:hypothetical protein